MVRVLPAGLLALAALQLQTPVPQRDQPPPVQMPTERRVPVGTSSIAGTVTAADSGRPIRGARVMVNGTTGPAPTRGGGPAPASSALPAAGLGRSQGPGAAAQPQPGISTAGGSSPAAVNNRMIVMSSASRSAVTDDSGAFLIDKLPAGQYSLSVQPMRNTFLPATYGQKKPNGPGGTITLVDGQRAKINMPLQRGAVITGTAVGEDGEPLIGSQIRASRYVMNGGVKRLQGSGYAQTDDRGVYRLFGLQPGDYLVSVTPDSSALMNAMNMNPDDALIAEALASGAINPPAAPGQPATVTIPIRTPQEQQQLAQQRQIDGPPPGYLPVYYPSSSMPVEATIVHVNAGEERSAIDIRTRLVQSTNIQGTVTNPPGEGLGVQVALLNDDPLSENTGGARLDNNGRFSIRNVAPGKYTLLAQVILAPTYTVVNGMAVTPQPERQLVDSQKWWGRLLLSVDGQPSISADVTLKPGRTISGRVVFEMERLPDLTRQKVMVMLSQAPGVQMGMYSPPPQTELAPDGSFAIKGVIPGKYTIRAQVGNAKSVIVNGQDLLDFPLNFTGDRDVTDAVLTVTDKYSEVSGALTDSTGKPAVDYMIVAASSDERYWTPGSRRIAVARPTADGNYSFRNLPPGEYLLAAVTDLENGGQYDIDFLKSLSSTAAMRISVIEGGKISQDLRVGR